MADIDVSELFSDPDFVVTFDVIRRRGGVDNFGIGSVTPETFKDVQGYVMQTDPSTNQRQSDAQMAMETIEVGTTFRLNTASENQQPDIIVWEGKQFTVVDLQSRAHWGSGYMWATCVSRSASDPQREGECLGD